MSCMNRWLGEGDWEKGGAKDWIGKEKGDREKRKQKGGVAGRERESKKKRVFGWELEPGLLRDERESYNSRGLAANQTTNQQTCMQLYLKGSSWKHTSDANKVYTRSLFFYRWTCRLEKRRKKEKYGLKRERERSAISCLLETVKMVMGFSSSLLGCKMARTR